MAGTDRTAWITGGGRGIGEEVALSLAADGYDVAVSARSEDELAATAKACREHGVEAIAAPCDVTDEEAVARAYETVADELAAPGVLVNNAGIARGIPFQKTTPEDIEQHFQVNLMGAYHCTQAALDAMLEAGWGRIVNVASVAGKVGAPYTTAYTISKHGLVGLTRALAQEIATSGVTVNAVCPGYVDTPMTAKNADEIAAATGISREDALETLEKMSPQERLMTPEEVAAQVTHLCREASRGIHGQTITIDGGKVQS